jgi:glutamyl/glutaminyl-tRNA synthetase
LFLNTSFGGLLPAAFITQDNLDLLNVIYMWMNSEFSNGDFDEKAKTFIHTVADGTGIKLGDIAKPLRMVLTHNKNSPPMDVVMLTLGKDAIYKRMDGTMALMGQVLAEKV